MKQLTRLMVMTLLAVALLAGCTRQVDGAAVAGSREVDPAYFFAGETLAYGQTVSSNDATALAYLRAMRRIDPCGLLNRDALAKIGEIRSVGTLFALEECDIDIKMAGESGRRYASIELTLARVLGMPVAFRAGTLPVYQPSPAICDYLLPLDLATLPGAQPLRKPDQPFLRIGLISSEECEFAQQLVRAVAPTVESLRLPARDAIAAYPVPLAERDPCQVLSVLGPEVDRWDIGRSRPYECAFGMWRNVFPEVASLRVSLRPQMFDAVTQTRERQDHSGVELYVDTAYCSATAFVGPPMQRRLPGGDFVATGDVVIRPAVVVEGGQSNCEYVSDVAAAAAKLYA